MAIGGFTLWPRRKVQMDDINNNHLSANERSKIIAARQHFAEINVPYAAPARSLRQALTIVGDGNCDI